MDTTHNTNTDNPLLAALFLGPAVIFLAASEELTRALFITR
jgi:hypothetical protein